MGAKRSWTALSELKEKKRISGTSGVEMRLSFVKKQYISINSNLSVDKGKLVFVLRAKEVLSWKIEGKDI